MHRFGIAKAKKLLHISLPKITPHLKLWTHSAGEQGMSPWHILRNARVEHTEGLQRDFTKLKFKNNKNKIWNTKFSVITTIYHKWANCSIHATQRYTFKVGMDSQEILLNGKLLHIFTRKQTLIMTQGVQHEFCNFTTLGVLCENVTHQFNSTRPAKQQNTFSYEISCCWNISSSPWNTVVPQRVTFTNIQH